MSCEYSKKDELSEVGKILQGEHELRKFNIELEEGNSFHSSYFLFSGSTSGGTYKNTKITFSFRLPDSSYAMAELNLVDIRVKIDSNITKPYVTFHWRPGGWSNNMRDVMSYYVDYMVVHCGEEDFPYEININKL